MSRASRRMSPSNHRPPCSSRVLGCTERTRCITPSRRASMAVEQNPCAIVRRSQAPVGVDGGFLDLRHVAAELVVDQTLDVNE